MAHKTPFLIAALVAIAMSAHAEPRRTYVAQDRAQCRAEPSLAWCGGARAGGSPDMAIIRSAEADARKGFRYNGDFGASFGWATNLPAARSGAAWQGDCNSLTEAVISLAIERGFPADHIWRALVRTPYAGQGDEIADHQVGIAEDANGKLWMIGDVAAHGTEEVGPGFMLDYQLVLINQVSDPGDTWLFADNHLLKTGLQ